MKWKNSLILICGFDLIKSSKMQETEETMEHMETSIIVRMRKENNDTNEIIYQPEILQGKFNFCIHLS